MDAWEGGCKGSRQCVHRQMCVQASACAGKGILCVRVAVSEKASHAGMHTCITEKYYQPIKAAKALLPCPPRYAGSNVCSFVLKNVS
eukprot:1145488-Pelagomonas_calceolata.AAC.1